MEKHFFTSWRIGLVVVFAFSIILYLPSIMGGAVWDDVDLISGAAFGKNTLLSAFTHPFLGHYFRPLTSASFVIESSFAKATPFYYHQTNILLHAITAVLVAALTMAVTKNKLAGFFAGLFLAAQPMQVGAAAWIGGRTDVMSTTFLAAFMLALVTYYKSKKPWVLYFSAFLFLLATISKEQAMAALPAVPLSAFVFGETKDWKEARKVTVPYMIALVIFSVMWVLDAPGPSHASNPILFTLALFARTNALYGLGFAAPNKQALLTWTLENYQGALWIAIGTAITVACAFAFRFCWKRHREMAWILVCGILVYMPVSNLPTVPSFVAGPYRVAEPGTAIACLFGAALAWALRPARAVAAVALAANFVAGTMITVAGIQIWTSAPNLFELAAKTDPHFIVGVGNYAQSLNDAGKPKEGLKWTNNLLVWIFGNEKWRDVLRTQKLKAFTPDVNRRLCTNGGNPDMRALGWFVSNQGGCYAKLKDIENALDCYKDALVLAPQDARIHFGYGQLILSFDRPEAIQHWEYALKLMPRYAVCASALAHERLIDKRYADVIKLLEPNMDNVGWNCDAWFDLADAKMGLRDWTGASAALDGAEKAIFVKKPALAEHRKKLKELIAASKHK